jgi:integrase
MALLAEQSHFPAHLLERLMEVVRPEFRADVFRPPRDSIVFFTGECVVEPCPTLVSHTARGLCEGHYQRWKKHQRDAPSGAFNDWLVAEAVKTLERSGHPAACLIQDCNRAAKSQGMCNRHAEAWTRSNRPSMAGWVAQTAYTPPRGSLGERACSFPLGCPRWTDGPSSALCRSHYERWRTHGRPDLQQWFLELEHAGDPKLRLGHLEPHLKLEVQFGLQCRQDEAVKRAVVRTLRESVSLITLAHEHGLSSLLSWNDDQWSAFIGGTRTNRTSIQSTALQFIRDTRLRLHILLVENDVWGDQFPRDTWDLRVLGIQSESVRYFRFEGIPQRWLRDLTKRWIRWRMSQGLDPASLSANVSGVTNFAVFLGPDAVIEALDRGRIEAWLARLLLEFPDASSRRAKISSLATLLRDSHIHSWAPDLPRTAISYNDTPPRKLPKPRWIPEDLMRQMEAPANLAFFPSDDGRLVLKILMNCGLRLKDARKLPIDCITRDASGAPYLAWINHKIQQRPAFFPISEALATDIAAQQNRVRELFADQSPWLFPAKNANLKGSKSMGSGGWQQQLAAWLDAINLVHQGQPTKITAHRFRHTVGTRLINADVPQHVVQHLLDHMSPEMTAVYARLMDTTVREHWERATKVNAVGEIVDIDKTHPLADAEWMRLSMVRAKVTLPNGYCGAPIQTDCEHANPCLDCRFFLTTKDFLSQHQQQRDETAKLISDARNCGMNRIAEKNTKTLIKLETLIATLQRTGPRQIVAGGQMEDLDDTA